jgi:hypothetical protein
MSNDKSIRLTKRDLDHAHQVGFEEGLAKGRQEILDWLQNAYLDPKVERGSHRGEAILQVAKDASNHFNNRTKGKGRR